MYVDFESNITCKSVSLVRLVLHSNTLQEALRRKKLLHHTENEDHIRIMHLQQLKQMERLQHLQSVRRHNSKLDYYSLVPRLFVLQATKAVRRPGNEAKTIISEKGQI